MNEVEFWQIIEKARTAVTRTEEVPKWIESYLNSRSRNDILDFDAWLATCLKRSNNEELSAAGGKLCRMTGPLADDLWLYFRCWLVAQGKKAFDLALGDPGSLAS